MAARLIALGLGNQRTADVRAYFQRFTTLAPRNLLVSTDTVPRGGHSFETLLNAILASNERDFVIVIHGYPDGRGLIIDLANSRRGTTGTRTTREALQRLLSIGSRQSGEIRPHERQNLHLQDAVIRRLIQLGEQVRARGLNRVEFRGCNLGVSRSSVAVFRRFLGARSLGAPDLHSFFGYMTIEIGQQRIDNHPAAHRRHPFYTDVTNLENPAGQVLFCVEVDRASKPSTGHILANMRQALTRWVQQRVHATRQIDGNRLPVQGLWLLPSLDSNPTELVPTPPRAIFPLDQDFASHIVYVSGAS